MTCRGDDDVDAKRSRPSIGKPVKCHARKERVLLVGTRPADHIRASSQCGCIEKAGYMAAPERFAQMSDFPLAMRAPSIHGTSATSLGEPGMSACGGKAVVPQTSAEVRVWPKGDL